MTFARVGIFVAGLVLISTVGLCADGETPPELAPTPAPGPVLPAPNPYNEARILGVIPDYQTVTETKGRVAPLTAKQKWGLAMKESVDPFNIANAFLTAGFSQMGNQTPKYGEGGRAYGDRVAAAVMDSSTQNFFSAGLLATVLHQDPRYFRYNEGHGIVHRILYSVSRIAVARQDSGADTFNSSGIFGMMMGIGASNLYYPACSVRWPVMAGRLETSLFGSVTGNLMSEFWPDIQKRFFHKKQ